MTGTNDTILRQRILVIVGIVVGVAALAASVAGVLLFARDARAGPFPTQYDSTIKAAWAVWHPGDDWYWWRAQLYQESRLDPKAVSPAGAAGIAQFMRGTAAQYGLVDRHAAEPAIFAGAKLMRDNRRFWKSKRPDGARRKLSQAGYNCGNGNLVKAQAKCRNPRLYKKIVKCLHLVTGKYAKETLGYAPSIARWRLRML